MPKFIDLTGQIFGRLEPIRRVDNIFGRVHWLCKCSCGIEKIISTHCLVSGNTKSCGCLRSDTSKGRVGKLHPSWKGGKGKDKSGYVRFRQKANKGVAEHRLIMEQYLGRKLLSNETVHHKNGIRDDNRIENLEVWSSRHPGGQRVEELVSWAEAILKTYKPEPSYISMLSAC